MANVLRGNNGSNLFRLSGKNDVTVQSFVVGCRCSTISCIGPKFSRTPHGGCIDPTVTELAFEAVQTRILNMRLIDEVYRAAVLPIRIA